MIEKLFFLPNFYKIKWQPCLINKCFNCPCFAVRLKIMLLRRVVLHVCGVQQHWTCGIQNKNTQQFVTFFKFSNIRWTAINEQQLIADVDLYYWLLLFYVKVTVGTMHIHRRFILTVIFLNKEHHASCHKLIFLNKWAF